MTQGAPNTFSISRQFYRSTVRVSSKKKKNWVRLAARTKLECEESASFHYQQRFHGKVTVGQENTTEDEKNREVTTVRSGVKGNTQRQLREKGA